jgi:methionyl-tRNA formyltransferase
MGADSFSLPVLQAILERGSSMAPALNVVGVVTPPDRPAGRGRTVRSSQVKQAALERALPLLQPERVRDPDSLKGIADLHPDLIVVAAFGQILPKALLDLPPHGCLNLHPSLLPRYRGPSPIVAPILRGDDATGATLMLMTAKMDAGPILSQEPLGIGPDDTAGMLESRLARLSGDLLLKHLPAWSSGLIKPRLQDEALATYTTFVRKEDGLIDWSVPAKEIARHVRAYQPWPVAFTPWADRQLRVLRSREVPGSAEPGQAIGMRAGMLGVGTGEGLLAIETLQLSGGRAMPSGVAVRGHPALLSARFG